jgi:non-ribosomal peptide synthetase component E (peptide arylation enzyme)
MSPVHYQYWFILFREIIAVYSENHTKRINIFYGQNAELRYWMLKQVVHIVTIGFERLIIQQHNTVLYVAIMLHEFYSLTFARFIQEINSIVMKFSSEMSRVSMVFKIQRFRVCLCLDHHGKLGCKFHTYTAVRPRRLNCIRSLLKLQILQQFHWLVKMHI